MANKSSPVVIAFLEELLKQAKKTEMTELFFWLRTKDGSSDYDFMAHDVQDMLYELRTVILREQMGPIEYKPPTPSTTPQ